MTVSEACAMHLERIDNDPNMKPATRHYWRQISVALIKSWPSLNTLDVRKPTSVDCREWSERFKKQCSPTRFNNTLSFLRNVFVLAIETGARFNNPAAQLKRTKIRPKTLTLPDRKQFQKLVVEIETAGAWCSRDCADLVRFLAFTGCRIGEAAEVTWRDVDIDGGVLTIRGDMDTATKNWEIRRVPLIPEAAALLRKMRDSRPDEAVAEKVLLVNEAQKAMDNAALRVGMERITHHDLRHLFATTCIESGIDIPTVSRWLGHKDGGALAMKTYGHLRDDHSMKAAAKVSFA
jgi:integrase